MTKLPKIMIFSGFSASKIQDCTFNIMQALVHIVAG